MNQGAGIPTDRSHPAAHRANHGMNTPLGFGEKLDEGFFMTVFEDNCRGRNLNALHAETLEGHLP